MLLLKVSAKFREIQWSTSIITGFDLTTRDSYFTILIEVFTNHILTENAHFTNRIRANRT